ncbi:DUF3563 family protein [Xinfangfangia sp. CPCC 101601]|uniref:DUF3563 family protein n=1 Tax=Pseudogemmobacter lacusdianii TaxID=3069608 RepID=A0ABU0VTJ9_9RHOB|nr:DUF3563 family protein [Xinfangfangia sp. CPCC 101601]MDQ2065036.1 DUF3563 family protein [Xinfangfangia sp. CPCC 101601]
MFYRLKSILTRLRASDSRALEEAFLADSTSLVDLEQRLRRLDMARLGLIARPW